MENKDKLIAVYSRKSKFTGKGESIGNQTDLCKAYAQSLFGDACRFAFYEDEGFSGGNLKRPAFQQMMAEARKGIFQAIIVYRLDRISRNISDFTGLIDELNKLGVSFISIREQFDTSTPMGRAMMFIISVFSQLERETIAERIRDNMHGLAKTGRWLGGNAPTGFRSEAVNSVTVDGKVRKAFRLVPIPEEAQIPKMLFDLYTATDSLTAVEAELLRRGIKTKQGKHFTRFAIKGILQNPVYLVADQDAYKYFTQRHADVCFPQKAFDGSCGIMAYHRTNQDSGSASSLLPVTDWIIAIGKHPGLVPSRQWIQVQESLERNQRKAYHKARTNEALLTGTLFCSCGERMYPKLTQRLTASGERIYTYVCKQKERSKGTQCNQRNVSGNALDAAVLAQLRQLSSHRSNFLAQLDKSRNLYAQRPEPHGTPSCSLQAEYAANEKRIGCLLDALSLAEDAVTRVPVLKRIEELTQLNRELLAQIREAEAMPADTCLDDADIAVMGQALAEFCSCVDQMTTEEKRQTIRELVFRVVWDGTNAHVLLFGTESN